MSGLLPKADTQRSRRHGSDFAVTSNASSARCPLQVTLAPNVRLWRFVIPIALTASFFWLAKSIADMTPAQFEQAIGPEVLDSLAKQTGLSKDDLLSRLSRSLPDAVDSYTPEGRLPAHQG